MNINLFVYYLKQMRSLNIIVIIMIMIKLRNTNLTNQFLCKNKIKNENSQNMREKNKQPQRR